MKPAAVFCLDADAGSQAKALAAELALPLIEASDLSADSSRKRLRFFRECLSTLPALVFLVGEDRLQLALIEADNFVSVSARFHGSGIDYRRRKGGGRSEMVARAVGLKGRVIPTVLDATAGLGVDSFVLASLGCPVTLLERVPAVCALLQDGLRNSRLFASTHDAELVLILKRMRLVPGDGAEYLTQLKKEDQPDVVYLDPMFPERRKSAAVKKEMQIFHKLVGPDLDAVQLFESALSRARDRVVVKRPRIAPAISGLEPSHVIEGKRNRYDVYLANQA